MKDLQLQRKASSSNYYTSNAFRGGGKSIQLIWYKGKIVIPRSLQKSLAEWYHLQLGHPGETRTELTIRQHFWWKGLKETIKDL
jgi:hypothetical protein